MSLSETLMLKTGSFHSRTTSWTHLLSEIAMLNEATLSSIQCNKVIYYPIRPNTRPEDWSLFTTHSHYITNGHLLICD